MRQMLDSTRARIALNEQLDRDGLMAYADGSKTIVESVGTAAVRYAEGTRIIAANDQSAINDTPLEDFASGAATLGDPTPVTAPQEPKKNAAGQIVIPRSRQDLINEFAEAIADGRAIVVDE